MLGHNMHLQMNVKQRDYLRANVDICRRQTTEEKREGERREGEEERREEEREGTESK